MRVRPGEVVEFAARGFGKHPNGIAPIECEDLRLPIPEPLRGNQSQGRGLSGAARPDDQVMAEIRDVEIEAEQRGSQCARECDCSGPDFAHARGAIVERVPDPSRYRQS